MVYLTKSQQAQLADYGAVFLALPCRNCGCGIRARSEEFKKKKDAERKDTHYKKGCCADLKAEREAEQAASACAPARAPTRAPALAPAPAPAAAPVSTLKALHRCKALEEQVREACAKRDQLARDKEQLEREKVQLTSRGAALGVQIG